MKQFNRYQPQIEPIVPDNGFECYVPDFTNETNLYRVDDEPINIIDNSNNVPFIQNVAQQTLVDVGDSLDFDTSGLSDKQLASGCFGRQYESSDLEDIANGNLSVMYKSKIQNE